MRLTVQEYVSLAEGAQIVAVSVDTLRRRIRCGQLPAVRDGRIIRILIEDLHSLFEPVPTADGYSRRRGSTPAKVERDPSWAPSVATARTRQTPSIRRRSAS